MIAIEQLADQIRVSSIDLVSALQTGQGLREEAFGRLDAASRELARQLKGSDILPRKLINELYMTAKILENEAPYAKDRQRVSDMASVLFMTFDLILLGESHEDRQSGVPRIR